MVAFSRIRAGDELWDVHREKMGNTTMSRLGSWRVLVVSVDPETRTARCKWNGNPAKRYSEHMLKALRRSPAKGAKV